MISLRQQSKQKPRLTHIPERGSWTWCNRWLLTGTSQSEHFKPERPNVSSRRKIRHIHKKKDKEWKTNPFWGGEKPWALWLASMKKMQRSMWKAHVWADRWNTETGRQQSSRDDVSGDASLAHSGANGQKTFFHFIHGCPCSQDHETKTKTVAGKKDKWRKI